MRCGAQFQPFDSGEFLVSGLRRGAEANRHVVAAILASDGTWLKTVDLPKDNRYRRGVFSSERSGQSACAANGCE